VEENEERTKERKKRSEQIYRRRWVTCGGCDEVAHSTLPVLEELFIPYINVPSNSHSNSTRSASIIVGTQDSILAIITSTAQ
jgi:hypothetical protein